jgi:hypothetical protein
MALVQIGIEGIGVFGTIFIKQQRKKANGKGVDNSDLTAEFEKIETWGAKLNKTLSGSAV